MFETTILILAAGYNKRSDKPCSLWSFGNGKSILDWQISAFRTAIPKNKINIAIGFDYQRILANHPKHTFRYVFDWRKSKALHSFLSITNDYSKHTLVMYGDTVFHHNSISELNCIEGDVVVAVDSLWKNRFTGRSKEDIEIAETLQTQDYGEVEYTGLVKFSPKAMEWILQSKDRYHLKSSFIDLLNDLRDTGFKITTYDVAGNWAEMNEQSDLAHFILGSKAETLQRIQPKLTKSKICDQVTCTWDNWKNNNDHAIKEVQSKFRGKSLIIRSSSIREDGWETANAGVFDSVLNVNCDDTISLCKAIENVFQSYQNFFLSSDVQVLVQPFINDVMISGVIFTCELITGAPYYVINYDDNSGQTDTITSGRANDTRTVIVFRDEIKNILSIDPRLVKVIEAAIEVEQLLGYDKLDIEFAIDKNSQCFTFQIRPIAVNHKHYQIDKNKFNLNLNKAQKQFNSLQKKSPNILGNYTVFSRMTDWNPAEIIGTRPNALAINLYNHLITEEVWAEQRAEYGYADIRPAPLVQNFCAQPYVDCRASINSFIPSDLSRDCALNLVETYLKILKDNPHLHDKLELDVVFTIWAPSFSEDVKERFKDHNVPIKNIKELEQSLKKLTAHALLRLDKDTSSIVLLSKRLNLLVKSDLEPVDKIYQLIEDCRRFGTLAFAHAARAGFVAITLLKSLVKLGYLTQDRMLEFQESVQTVAGDFQLALSDHDLSIDEITKQFGHLRPGTYDVNELAYWEKPNFYFTRNKELNTKSKNDKNKFIFSKQELRGFQFILDELPIKIEINDFIRYFSNAIQAREYCKFEFTRNLSASLDLIIEYGVKALKLTREDTGYLTFDDFKGLRTGQLNENLIQNFVKLRKSDFNEKHLIKLPGFISDEKDFFGYEQEKSETNFITRLNIIADLLFIKLNQDNIINGKIVAVPNADPGFDWIFAHNISGLITQYGGANSHMAIRCAELGIPAAIGVGEKFYESLYEGRLMLDCQNGRIEYV